MKQKTVNTNSTISDMLIDAGAFVSEMEKALDASDLGAVEMNTETLEKLIQDMASYRAQLGAIEQRARALQIRARAETMDPA